MAKTAWDRMQIIHEKNRHDRNDRGFKLHKLHEIAGDCLSLSALLRAYAAKGAGRVDQKTAWDRMQIIHEKNRPTVRDYLPMVFENFIELHGDRFYGDDAAILGGIGTVI